MFDSRNETSVIDEVALARKAKQSLDDLSPFLNCPVTPASAKKYVNTLVKHDILYYFEQDANDVVIYDTDEKGNNRENSFTSKQATMLNVICNRFKENERSFEALFDAVFCSDAECLEHDDDRAADLRFDEFEIVDRICSL